MSELPKVPDVIAEVMEAAAPIINRYDENMRQNTTLSPILQAIAEAVADAPKFREGDCVRVLGNITSQERATILRGPELHDYPWEKGVARYLIALDHNRYEARDGSIKQVNQWCDAKRLVALECCESCGEEACAGEEHGG